MYNIYIIITWLMTNWCRRTVDGWVSPTRAARPRVPHTPVARHTHTHTHSRMRLHTRTPRACMRTCMRMCTHAWTQALTHARMHTTEGTGTCVVGTGHTAVFGLRRQHLGPSAIVLKRMCVPCEGCLPSQAVNLPCPATSTRLGRARPGWARLG